MAAVLPIYQPPLVSISFTTASAIALTEKRFGQERNPNHFIGNSHVFSLTTATAYLDIPVPVWGTYLYLYLCISSCTHIVYISGNSDQFIGNSHVLSLTTVAAYLGAVLVSNLTWRGLVKESRSRKSVIPYLLPYGIKCNGEGINKPPSLYQG